MMGTSCTIALLTGVAMAQPEGSTGEGTQAAMQSGGLEEIVVTARRREEKLQTVPVAVSVVSGDQLVAKSISNAVDLGKLIPALGTTQTNRDVEGYEIRGTANNNVTVSGQSPSITPYFAEVPYPFGDGGGPGRFFDLENVQVLKGPQGTLFGRNSTGGAVLLQPQKPTRDFGGYGQFQVGNYNDLEFQGAVNIPVSDAVLVRVAGERAQRDGFTRDILNGKDLDNRDYWGGRSSLTLRPTDDLENYLVIDSFYTDNNGTSEVIGAFNPSDRFGTVAGLPLFFGGNGPPPAAAATEAGRAAAAAAGGYAFYPLSELTRILALQRTLGPREVAVGNDPIEKYWSLGLSDIATWNISDEITFRNIFGYREFKYLARYTYDGTPLFVLNHYTPSGWNTNLAQYTEEAQIQAKLLDGALATTFGTFGLFSHTIGLSEDIATLLGAPQVQAVHPTSRSEAVYAQGTYDLGNAVAALDGLKFTAGYRYTWDYRALDLYQTKAGGACAIAGSDRNCVISVSTNGSAPAWTLGLDYQLLPETMLYVTARHGFRSGGLNSQTVIPSVIAYKPETVQDVEIGLKSDWEIKGIKARTNIAAYHADYADKQASQQYSAIVNGVLQTSNNVIVNVGDATIQGIEAELTVLPSPDLEIAANWAYNQAQYTKFLIASTGESVPGATFPFVPQNKLSLSARYHLPVSADMGDLSLSGIFAYQSHQYLGVQPADPAYTTIGGGYSTIDLSLDWKNILGSQIDTTFFVTNLTDSVYKIGGVPVYTTVGFASFVYSEPQMYGARIKYRFGAKSQTESAPAAYIPPPVQAPAPAVPKSYMVFFDFDKSDLTPQAAAIVDQAAMNVASARVTRITVTGHTDTVGSDAYNMRLSRRRAESVAAELEKQGISQSEIEIVAKGKRDLLVPTADGVTEPQNRRVQIVYSGGPAS
jgi:iron complex outermembrane receptor protein